MYVIKRNGSKVPIRYDSITDRNVEYGKDLDVDVTYLSQLVINSLKSGMTTSEIDDLSAETAFYLSCYEPDYDVLATRIAISNLHKSTSSNFEEVMKLCYSNVHSKTNKPIKLIKDDMMEFITSNASSLQSIIDFARDYKFNYFGVQTLKRLYLLRVNNKIVERPQHMFLRVSVAIHYSTSETSVETSLASIQETYDALSNHLFTHASPTLFNAGNPYGNLSSCFLLDMDDDLDHIFTTIKRCALISKLGGGIGVNVSKLRSKGSIIHSSGGKSDGIIPMVQVFNATARYANQQSRRAGSFAMYIEPSHPDILDFLQLRLPSPPEELRARDIFLGLWVPDLFMKRLEADEMWSLFCPSVVPELNETYGEEYETIYLQAEKDKKYSSQLPSKEVWKYVLQSQQETGLPYICYKDSINKKSNQKNIGIIRSSNLCVSGDTTIFDEAKLGYFPIENYKDKTVTIYNGFRFTKVVVKQTSLDSELYRVTFSNNKYVDCTDYHKIPYISERGRLA